MKEKIYTIPINEAFDKDSECPFCQLNKKLEKDILDYIMGPSYMEEDIRAETDKAGFCKDHLNQMFFSGNRLGLALMLNTHLKKINTDMDSLLDRELKYAGEKKSLFKKTEEASPFCEFQETLENSCYACKRLNARMDSYFETFFYLFKTEEDFRQKVAKSKGFCLEHFGRIVKEGKVKLNTKTYQEMLQMLIPIQKENFKRIEEELDWFIQKFDYRFQNEPWKNSKDSVERSILKISGLYIEE